MKRTIHSFAWSSRESQEVFWKYQKDMTVQAKEEVAQYMRLFGIDSAAGLKIFDVGCGVGYHAEAFSEIGAVVTGIDVSDFCLTQARERCADKAVTFVLSQAKDIDWIEAFDYAIAIRHTLGFMPYDELVEHMKRIYISIKSGGKLLLVIPFSLEMGRQHLPVHKWSDENGCFTLVDKYIDNDNFKIERCVIIDSIKDVIEEFHERQRFYSTNEVVDVLDAAGFSNIIPMKNIHGDDADTTSGAQAYIAEK